MFSPDVTLRCPRVAYAIGRNYGNAVQRNRIRRQSRSILRSHANSMPKGRYLIGVVKSTSTTSFSDLEVDLKTLISKVERLEMNSLSGLNETHTALSSPH